MIPFDTSTPRKTSGIRVGTPAITSRGFDEEAARKVAELIIRVAANNDDETLATVKEEVYALTAQFPLYNQQ